MIRPPQQPGPWPGQPPRKRRLLPWILTGGGILIVAVVVILVVVLTSGPDKSTPEGVADAIVASFNDSDFDELAELSCDGSEEYVTRLADPFDRTTASGDRIALTAELERVSMDGNGEALAVIALTLNHVPDELRENFGDDTTGKLPVGLREENGEWCTFGFNN
jgi:hypothetical protein